MSFNFFITNPLAQVSRYTKVLAMADFAHIQKNLSSYKNSLVNSKVDAVQKNYLNKDFRVVQYCTFIHPVTYQKYGNVPSWYDTQMIGTHVKAGKPLYSKAGVRHIEQYVKSQQTFLQKIKHLSKKEGMIVDERSILRYKLFMKLVQLHQGESLSPPFDVDIVWHGHMLDHEAYVTATKQYLGYVLDHNDGEAPAHFAPQQKKTEELWHKHYGHYSENAELRFLASYFLDQDKEKTSSCGGGAAASCGSCNAAAGVAGCGSCSGCGSGCGGG